MTQQCVNCPGAEDHSTAQCPVMAEASAVVNQQVTAADSLPVGVPDGYMPIPTAEQIADALESVRCFHDMSAELIAPELLANLLAATTVKAEQVQCEVCHGQGEVYSGHDQHFHYFDFQPPEPIMEVCPECGGEEAPSLPAAGSAELIAEAERCLFVLREIGSMDADDITGDDVDLRFEDEEGCDTGCDVSIVDYAEKSADVIEKMIAALSAQQSAQPEFCCELSYKAAKQKAWNARRIDRCKCDHNEYCDHCWPADFRPGGKWHGKFVARQPAHVSVQMELLADLVSQDHDTRVQAERRLYALLNGGEA